MLCGKRARTIERNLWLRLPRGLLSEGAGHVTMLCRGEQFNNGYLVGARMLQGLLTSGVLELNTGGQSLRTGDAVWGGR
jgi:hypothetical protein